VLGLSWRARARLVAPVCGVVLALCASTGVAFGDGLPDGRRYELVSPVDKAGGQIVPESTRTHAAAGESPGMPAAVSFISLVAFGDVQGTGISTEYLAQRDATPGTSGWATHGIFPAQEPESFRAIVFGLEPSYVGEMSPDLSKGVFNSWSPVTDAPNVAHVPNLYVREDLRTPGTGTYRLLTNATSPLAPANLFPDSRPFIADHTSDLQHVIFESALNLTSDARGFQTKLYKADGNQTRLVIAGPANAGAGASSRRYTPRTLSQDGSRVIFKTPDGRLFQLDDRGTPTTADDAYAQINATEATTPDTPAAARYEIASVDGSRVFFISTERLTNVDGGGLYLWARQPTNQTQSVTVDATGGTFTLSAHGQARDGSTDATTPPLAHDATAAQVQSALEALSVIGSGNVTVTGGPGNAGGTTPYLVTFTGALAGIDVAPLTTDASALTGGAATATASITTPVHNLSLIASTGSFFAGAIGASEDGHRLYFVAGGGQFVNGAPPVGGVGLYYWQDADGTPGGTLSFIGETAGGDVGTVVTTEQTWPIAKISRVTPDGRTMIFEVSNGSGLALRYDQSRCLNIVDGVNFGNPNQTGLGCSEVYVYRADSSTPTRPDLACASCLPSGAPGTQSAWLNIRRAASATTASSHLNHVLSDDGTRVFFSTQEALVPEDTNGKVDAYEYDVQTHTVHLLSTGKDSSDSFFLDASANGNDAYIITRQQLLGWDTDNAYDVYDARVGGGFPEPATPPQECAGDACQGLATGLPNLPALGSPTFRGAGNATPAPAPTTTRHHPAALKCKRGQIKHKTHGKTRCIKRPKKTTRHTTKRRAK